MLRRLLMFHGPIKEAVPFFEAMGFRCPERKDHASFLQEVTTPKGRPCSVYLPLWTVVLHTPRSLRVVMLCFGTMRALQPNCCGLLSVITIALTTKP